MREGWICPQCKRGVSPDVATCDHDVAGQLETARRFLNPHYLWIGNEPHKTPDFTTWWYVPPVTCGSGGTA